MENVCGFVLNGTGEVVAFSRSKGETAVMMESMLRKVKERCDRHRLSYPDAIFTDYANAHEACIKRIFPDCKVGQDLKHLINRPLEFVSRSHQHYGAFCKAFHQAFTQSSPQIARSRNGGLYNVAGLLDTAPMIIDRVDKVIDMYTRQCPGLIKADFAKCWATQKPQIEKYIFDPVINGEQTKYFHCK